MKRQRMNVDYRKKKPNKRSTHETMVYQEALVAGNPQSVMARINIRFDVNTGMILYVKGNPLHMDDYVSHFMIMGTMAIEEYISISDN